MKFKYLLLIKFLLLLITINLNALSIFSPTDDKNKNYVFLKSGIVTPKDKNDMSWTSNVYIYTVKSEPDSGNTFSIGYGYKFFNKFRIEGELSYNKLDINNYHIDISTVTTNFGKTSAGPHDMTVYQFMINSWYDFNINKILFLFLWGGLGVAHASIKDLNDVKYFYTFYYGPYNIYKDTNSDAFAYQYGLGLRYKINKSIIIDLAYKITKANFKFKKLYFSEFLKIPYKVNTYQIGINYLF